MKMGGHGDIEIRQIPLNFSVEIWYLCNQSADESEKEIEEVKYIGEPKHKVESIITLWLLRFFVVNLGEISGGVR